MSLEDLDSTEVAPLRADDVISLKISNILSTSYSDISIRRALQALDSRIDRNSLEARRQLRSNTENEVIKSNGAILKNFAKLAGKLNELGDTIEQLNNAYSGMDSYITQAHRATSQILNESTDLKAQDEKIIGKQVLLDAFQNTFIVSPLEVEVLTKTSTNNMTLASFDETEFFKALGRIKKIYENCQTLLVTDSRQTGEEIMTTMSEYLDQAYNKLFFLVQYQFKLLSGQYVQIGNKLRRLLVNLAERPTLFEYAMNGLSETRQKNLTSEFLKALTMETADSKPLDFYAYDPLRYVGDIMAWIHSATVNERENLDGLFETDTMSSGLKQGLVSEPWMENKLIDVKAVVDTQVDKITSSLANPLKIRVEQVLQTETRLTTIYQLSNVLNFYYSMFQKHFPTSAMLMVVIEKLQEAAMRQFDRCLEQKINTVKNHQLTQSKNGSDLQPPDFMFEALSDLKAILTSYESSISYSQNTEDTKLKTIVENLIEPYLECCNRIAGDMTNLMDSEIFQINCLDSVKMALSLFTFVVDYKIGQLDSRINEITDILVNRQLQAFMNQSGIRQFKEKSNDDNNNNHIDSNRQAVIELSHHLDYFLPAATMESNLELQKLSSPRLAATITLRASQTFAKEFEKIQIQISQHYSVDELLQVFPRSLQEVEVLLALT